MSQGTRKEHQADNEPNLSSIWIEFKRLFGIEKDRTFIKAIAAIPEKDSFAYGIENSIWFNALYGFLDGLSVVYSTIKFTCELVSVDKKDYQDNLNHVLSDAEFWLPLVIAVTISGTIFSVLGNYAGKKDKAEQHPIEAFCLAWLPYVRDILKGAKNGYKAIKTLVLVAVSHKFLDPSNIRMVALPIGLAFSIAAIINRCFIRSVNNKQKAYSNQFKNISKQVQKSHALYHELQQLETRMLDVNNALVPVQFQLTTNGFNAFLDKPKSDYYKKAVEIKAQEEKYLKEKSAIEAEMLVLQQQLDALNSANIQPGAIKALEDEVKQFQEQYNLLYLFSKGLGGFIDAPYLYLGVMSLAILCFQAFIFTSAILAIYVVACIAVRTNEGYDEQKDLSHQMMLVTLELAVKDFNERQANILKLKSRLFDEFKQDPLFDNFSAEELNGAFIDHLTLYKDSTFYKRYHAAFAALHDSYQQVDDASIALQKSTMPNYFPAVMHGMHDGLSAFGVLSSIYFLLAIILLAAAVAFPPALIIGGAVFGLVGMMCAVGIRLWYTSKEKEARVAHYVNWKQYIHNVLVAKEAEPENYKALLLSSIDVNTDYLTKGEFFAQGLFEIARNLLNSPYKAQNLTDFFLNQLDSSHSKLIAGFWAVIGIIYCAVLTLRAYGKTAKDKPVNFSEKATLESKQVDDKTKEVRPKNMPPPPPKGVACLHFKWLNSPVSSNDSRPPSPGSGKPCQDGSDNDLLDASTCTL